MKRIKLSLTVLAVMFAAVFTSCDKDVESSSVQLNLDKTATIKVYVYCDLDKTIAGLETAPSGTMIKVKINYADFKTGVAGAYYDTMVVDNNGIALIEVPADDNGVTVTLTPIPFEANQVEPFGTYEEVVLKLYDADPINITATANDIIIRQITYKTPEDFKDFVPMVTISGNLTAELNDTILGTENMNKAETLNFHNSEWHTSVTTNSQGEFSNVEVPANQTIFVTSGPFTNLAYKTGQGSVLYEFELKSKSIGSFAASAPKVVIDFGAGVKVD